MSVGCFRVVERANAHLDGTLVEESERMLPPSVVCQLHLTTVLEFNTNLVQPGIAMTSTRRRSQGAA
jgi:hypothetical protein